MQACLGRRQAREPGQWPCGVPTFQGEVQSGGGRGGCSGQGLFWGSGSWQCLGTASQCHPEGRGVPQLCRGTKRERAEAWDGR